MRSQHPFWFFVMIMFLLAFPLIGSDAELILHNGKIVTVDPGFSVKQAVAVKNGRITTVGNDQAVLGTERGPRTRVIDLTGRMVLPGPSTAISTPARPA